MKKIYITGISGTGKTTIYDELISRGFAAISLDETDDLCCWINKETKEKVETEVELNKDFTDTHSWVCDVKYLQKLLDNAMKNGSDLVFILGVASNQNDFLDMFDKVILLQCMPDTFIHRLTHRTNNDFGKDKTVQEAVLGWYEEFENKLIERGAISINTEKHIAEVVEEVLKQSGS